MIESHLSSGLLASKHLVIFFSASIVNRDQLMNQLIWSPYVSFCNMNDLLCPRQEQPEEVALLIHAQNFIPWNVPSKHLDHCEYKAVKQSTQINRKGDLLILLADFLAP